MGDNEPGTRAQLPYWVQQKTGYGGQVFLYGLYLGFVSAEWTVHAFPADEDGGCQMGARWAAQKSSDRVLVGPITIPDDIPVRSARVIPAKAELV